MADRADLAAVVTERLRAVDGVAVTVRVSIQPGLHRLDLLFGRLQVGRAAGGAGRFRFG